MMKSIAFVLPRFLQSVPGSTASCPSNLVVAPPLVPSYVEIAVICPCGCEDFSLTGYNWTNPELDDAESGWISPITATCKKCGRLGFILDTRADGYNAEIGSGEDTAEYGPATPEAELQAILCNQCQAPHWRLNVGLGFNADEGEQHENLVQMPDKSQSNLFEMVGITGTCAHCGNEELVTGFETA